MHVAIIDDDPMELEILKGLSADIAPDMAFHGFASLDAFCKARDRASFDAVFLDRRINAYTDFDETLPKIAASGFQGPVVLQTARVMGMPDQYRGLTLIGPVDKFDLLEPDRLSAILDKVCDAVT